MVARRGLGLFVAGIVFLIDNHQLQVFERQEDRRPHADDKLAPLGATQAQIGLRAAAVREFRVVGGDTAAEDPLHALDELRREGDLGDEQQHVAPRAEHLGDQMDVDFGLARPGDTLQQGGRTPCGVGCAQGGERLLLMGRQLRQTEGRAAALDRAFPLGHGDPTLAFEGVEHTPVGTQQTAGHLTRCDAGPVAGRGQFEQRLVLLRGPAFDAFAEFMEALFVAQRGSQSDVTLRAGAELLLGELLLRITRRLHQRRQRHAHHLADRTHVIGGNPLPQRTHRRREQRHIIEDARDGFYGLEIGTAVMDPPHNPGVEPAGAELYGHGLTFGKGEAVGYGERIGRLRQRQHDIGIPGHQGLLIAWKPLP